MCIIINPDLEVEVTFGLFQVLLVPSPGPVHRHVPLLEVPVLAVSLPQSRVEHDLVAASAAPEAAAYRLSSRPPVGKRTSHQPAAPSRRV